MVPVDNNTLYGSAASEKYFVSETFVFTKPDKSEASAVQEVYLLIEGGDSVLVQASRIAFTRVADADTFVQLIQDGYDRFNVTEAGRLDAPMTETCLGWPDCPTEDDWCTIDPKCT